MGQGSKGSSETQPFQQSEQLRRQAYMQMMGGGNYGGVIPQQQPGPGTPQPPPGTPPPATGNPANTRYGVWKPSDNGGGDYSANLPWGLFTSSIGGAPASNLREITFGGGGPGVEGMNARMTPTGLQWDNALGQVVGGDAQLDQFRSMWHPGAGDFGSPFNWRDYGFGQGSNTGFGGGWMREAYGGQGALPEGWNSSTEWGIPTPPGWAPTSYPDWWASANDPNATMGGSWAYDPNTGYTNTPGAPGAPPPASWLGTGPTYTPPPPNPGGVNVIRGDQLGVGGLDPGKAAALAGSGGDGGYVDPWAGLNGANQAMTNASSYGNSPWSRRRGRG